MTSLEARIDEAYGKVMGASWYTTVRGVRIDLSAAEVLGYKNHSDCCARGTEDDLRQLENMAGPYGHAYYWALRRARGV